MSNIKITTLVENSCFQGGFTAEHGLSLLIETHGKQLLFDTGASDHFIANAHKLGIDIEGIDYLVLSHGHYDHTGGLSFFMEKNSKAPVYLKKEVLQPKYNGDRYIGIDPEIDKKNPRFSFVAEPLEIVPSLWLMPSITIFNPKDQHISNFTTEVNGEKTDDSFADELFLCLVNEGKITLVSSCSHNGITNMAITAQRHFQLPIERIIGGFHIIKANEESANIIASYLNEAGVNEVHTCHCTGIEQFARLKQQSKASVNYNYTGNIINF